VYPSVESVVHDIHLITHWNKELPPVDCPLLIQVPAYIPFTTGPDKKTYCLDKPVGFKVRRKNWERSKEATPTYYDTWNNTLSGKLLWTYP
jgi:hypothetical protein